MPKYDAYVFSGAEKLPYKMDEGEYFGSSIKFRTQREFKEHLLNLHPKFRFKVSNSEKSNPAPRKGTASVKRPSQITGEAPTKRLVKRRKANTQEGYFPNPISSELRVAFEASIYSAIEKAHDKKGASLVRQAKLSYAQGLIDAGYMLDVFGPMDAQHFLSSLRGTDK